MGTQIDAVAAALDEVDKTLDPDTNAAGETIDALAAVARAWNDLITAFRGSGTGDEIDVPRLRHALFEVLGASGPWLGRVDTSVNAALDKQVNDVLAAYRDAGAS